MGHVPLALGQLFYVHNFTFTASPCRKSCVILLEMGADINSPDIVGWTPLLWAAKAGNVGVAELLLERGVLTDHVDIDGNAALHVAAHFNQVETTRILMDYGASLLVLNKRGMTYLDVAMEAQNNEVVMVVVKHQRYCNTKHLVFPSNSIPLYNSCSNDVALLVSFICEQLRKISLP